MRRLFSFLCVLCSALSCTGPNDSPSQPSPQPGAITLALATSAATVPQGGSATIGAAVTRNGTQVGDVTVAVTGAPTGVTTSTSGVTTAGLVTNATINVQVGAATVPGRYTLTITAGATGVTSVSATYELNVESSAGYTLSLTPTSTSIAASTSGQVAIALGRTNFTGNVTLSLVGAPSGVTGSFGPASTTGNTSTLTISVDAGVTPGTYTATVRGVAASLTDRNTTLTLIVAARPSISVSSSSATLSTAQNTTVTTTITLNRTSYTGPVDFRLSSNVPAGVTVSFNPATTSGNTTVMTVTIGPSVVIGTFNAIAAAEASGLQTATVIVPVTVTGPSIGLSLVSTGLLIVQNGASANTTLNITRTLFPGVINITLEGAPNGMTVTANPASTTGNVSTITVSATQVAAAGNYTITVRATPVNAPGGPVVNTETINFSVVVQQAAGGNSTASVDFTSCSADQRPIWVATQNGDFSFERNNGTNNVYTWSVANGKGSIAYVLQGAGGSTTLHIQSMSLTEWTAPGSRVFCPTPSGTRNVAGTIAGLGMNEIATVSLGGATTGAVAALPAFTVSNAPSGVHDLVVYARGPAGPSATDRVGFVRDVPNASTNVGSFNTAPGSGNAVTVSGAAITLAAQNQIGNEVMTHAMFYNAGASCSANPLYTSGTITGSTFTAYGAGSLQRASDRHGLTINVTNGSNASRLVTEYFNTLGSRTVTLPTLMLNSPPGTTTGSNYKRFFYGTNQPADLTTSVTMTYTQVGAPRTISWTATWGWAQGTSMILTVPAFQAISGWTDSWVPAAGSSTTYSVTHLGTNITTNACALANARFASATFTGTN